MIQELPNAFQQFNALKLYIVRDVKLVMEIAIEAEVLFNCFKKDPIMHQLALNKLINQVNNSNKMHASMIQEFVQKNDELKEKINLFKEETRDIIENIICNFETQEIKDILYKYSDSNYDEIVNPYWQFAQKVQKQDISEKQLKLLQEISKTRETLLKMYNKVPSNKQQFEKDMLSAIQKRKEFMNDKIQYIFK